MPKQDDIIRTLVNTIEGSVDKFNQSLSGIQEKMFDEVLSLTKELELSGGKIKNSVANLKLIMQIKNKLQKIIISKKYEENVKSFIATFNEVAKLQQQYFTKYLKQQDKLPQEKLDLIREYSIGNTINQLTESGLNVNVIDKVEDIIRQNTTTGGSYASMQQQLRQFIITDENTDGALERYAKTITVNAINQYSRQYMETTAADLNMPWRKFVGSLKTTSREWCIKMVDLKYIHISQLPELVKGMVDGHQCAIYAKTGLPYGMIDGTDAQNVLARAGGHGCEHGFYPCLESEVPKEILDKFYNRHPEQKKPEAEPEPEKQITKEFKIVKEQKTIKDLSDTFDLFSKTTTHFSRGFKSIQPERSKYNNGSTDMNGKIMLSKTKSEAVISALNKIREGKEKTEHEEKGLATLWHEIWHNRNQKGNMRLTKGEAKYMELGNEFVARNTLDEFMDQLGTKLVNTDLKNNRTDTGYNDWVVRYSKMIKALGIDHDTVVQDMVKSMETASYREMKTELVNALKNNYTGKQKIAFTKAVEVCLQREDDFDQFLETYSLK